MKKIIAVIGMGRFGIGLVKALSSLNVDVIAVDKDKERLAMVGEYVRDAFVCDSTNPNGLEEAGVDKADDVIVSFGQDNQAFVAISVMTIVALTHIHAKHITVRIDDDSYAELMLKVGADSLMSPFDLASERLALKVGSQNVMDYYHISGPYSIYELKMTDDVEPISLIDLAAPSKYRVNILLYIRDGKTLQPDRDYVIQPGDHIFALGELAGINKMRKYLENPKRVKKAA